MRGPKPVNEVLQELHRGAFGSTSIVMPPMPVNTRPFSTYTDSDRIEIISNVSDTTHISELAEVTGDKADAGPSPSPAKRGAKAPVARRKAAVGKPSPA